MIYFCPLISKTLEKNINKEILWKHRVEVITSDDSHPVIIF